MLIEHLFNVLQRHIKRNFDVLGVGHIMLFVLENLGE